ncbi:Spindle-body formation-associated protein [Penicillium argentinense]|uniref:Spindle-body formation-associated protein n=1 Tax=Penicillium argentinense TaxID=1131581 RepID=A0A9W9KB64_9EURO|nr:Spindle-body formation-associated protein [Penicillium argentinense]KAJ5099810.1 Spindle-body formation-associated protein [Penicillium argentinense]
MLDWMKSNEGPQAADTSKVLEPPETPAPVFAIRAFKSALFGTPGAEEEENEAKQAERVPDLKPSDHQCSKSDATQPFSIPTEKKDDAKSDDSFFNPAGSPTKSILVTPGTISNRRKTVSFGEGVVDNEGKRDSQSSKVRGNLTTQWMSGSADGKPRSKLTQTLIDARDNASRNADSAGTTPEKSDAKPVARAQPKDESGSEDTINLEDPRSESGKYWKTEFDNYRSRTNREIKKLIHYRSIAKSYARKKDSEAIRLTDKLLEEEKKVAEMECQVSRLASTIVGEGSQGNKEELIQDLTKQTALALQYKQQVTSLRKILEQQGVVEGSTTKAQEPAKESSSSNTSEELRKAQQELKQANAKIEELMRRQNQDSDLKALKSLAQSSEKKAQDLEKENNSLKQTMARVKQEMSKYDGRRKEKENRLKQRESRLETRIQEYREQLKKTTQEHRASEDALRASFDEERRRMQTQIDLLKSRISNTERVPTLRPQQRQTFNPCKEYSGVRVYDFADQNRPEIDEATEDLEAPPSPSPRSKARHIRNATTGTIDPKRATQDINADDDEVTHYLNEILDNSRPKSYHFDGVPAPPSSPPDIGALKSLDRNLRNYQPTTDKQRTYRSLYRRDPDTTGTGNEHDQRSRPHIRSTLDNISGLPCSRTGAYAGYTISGGERASRQQGLSEMERNFLSPERVAAAKSRLQKKKDESRRSRTLGGGSFRAVASARSAGS